MTGVTIAQALSLGKNSDERDERSQDHHRLKADRSHDPLRYALTSAILLSNLVISALVARSS
jgi:hypothetical protein